jgi:UDP-3-O-[3-hydroxymyristoyl] glucosamine N-acyltransferase
MEITARKLAQILNGSIVGNVDVVVTQPAKIEEATTGQVSFIANRKYEQYAATTKASILIVNEQFNSTDDIEPTLIVVKDSYTAFTKVLEMFARSRFDKTGIEQNSSIAASAKIGHGVYIGAFVVVADNVKIGNNVKIFGNVTIGENSVIGDNTIIFSGANIYYDSVIGNNCIIHSGAVIGSDGFGFAPKEDGSYHKIPQLGNVLIEDDVEIGANTCIDRATIGSTIIRKGVKLDDLVMVAHNVEIGENTVIAAQSGISGSTKIGKNCVIGGQVGFAGHITVADGSRIGAQTGVNKTIKEPNKAWTDSPAFNFSDSLKSRVIYRHLPEMEKRLRDLEQLLKKDKQE